MQVPTKKGGGHVLVAAAEEIKQFSLYRCGKAVSCRDCVALQDPYCAWDTSQEVNWTSFIIRKIIIKEKGYVEVACCLVCLSAFIGW